MRKRIVEQMLNTLWFGCFGWWFYAEFHRVRPPANLTLSNNMELDVRDPVCLKGKGSKPGPLSHVECVSLSTAISRTNGRRLNFCLRPRRGACQPSPGASSTPAACQPVVASQVLGKPRCSGNPLLPRKPRCPKGIPLKND